MTAICSAILQSIQASDQIGAPSNVVDGLLNFLPHASNPVNADENLNPNLNLTNNSVTAQSCVSVTSPICTGGNVIVDSLSSHESLPTYGQPGISQVEISTSTVDEQTKSGGQAENSDFQTLEVTGTSQVSAQPSNGKKNTAQSETVEGIYTLKY